ncbi:asparagine synthase (glutamine-hydrolyzing) [Candidatus Pacearchaeota archaeon]|nr:asparagine synthase (glutamine-hydrolyzing) [Candidatus Pacearchaeota archaeon]|tara:strand:- start:979 stop:2937 length:1959 start_codon:yes stop_codon:yes gene_type:complete
MLEIYKYILLINITIYNNSYKTLIHKINMCGINGFTFENPEAIREMNRLLNHRGPDANGQYVNNITLGHTRLKIIDLSENAAQPMADNEEDLILTFNGEIYNFQELRTQLEQLGHKLKSKSDTEVIIYAYKEWGYNCVDYFNGMWAFAIYDKKKNKIFLSRDKIGKKPLYYHENNNLIFSSEIKPLFIHNIERKLNKPAASSFLSYRYILGDETMFKNIYKLPPAHNMIYDLTEKKIERIWEYWDITDEKVLETEEDIKNKTEYLLKDAVRLRQVSDVPIATTNSGGLDSSVVTSMMAQMHSTPIISFTVKFPEEEFDESEFAKILSDYAKTDHREILIDTQDYFNLMKEYVKIKDEPIGMANEIATYAMFKKIKKDATVIMTGEGADELFAGYGRIFSSTYDYQRLKRLEKINKIIYETDYPSLHKKYHGKFFETELDHFLFQYNYFPEEEKNFILNKESQEDFKPIFKKYFDRIDGDYKKKISYTFLKLHLPVILGKLDNSAMASAVEVRAPFLDYRMVNHALNLPSKYKTRWKSKLDQQHSRYKLGDEISENHDTSKYILKEVSKKYIPQQIIDRNKKPFPVPLQKWFKEDFLNEAKRLLLSEDSRIKMVCKQDNLKVWIEKGIISEEKLFGQRLWRLVSLELWLREWF